MYINKIPNSVTEPATSPLLRITRSLDQVLENSAGHEQRIAFLIYEIVRDATVSEIAQVAAYARHGSAAGREFSDHVGQRAAGVSAYLAL